MPMQNTQTTFQAAVEQVCPTPPPSPIVKLLRGQRKRLRFSQESVAAAGGVSQQSYSEYERGERPPSLEAAKRLARKLKINGPGRIIAAAVKSGLQSKETELLQRLAKQQKKTLAQFVDGLG